MLTMPPTSNWMNMSVGKPRRVMCTVRAYRSARHSTNAGGSHAAGRLEQQPSSRPGDLIAAGCRSHQTNGDAINRRSAHPEIVASMSLFPKIAIGSRESVRLNFIVDACIRTLESCFGGNTTMKSILAAFVLAMCAYVAGALHQTNPSTTPYGLDSARGHNKVATLR